jgi:hypothetical protein
MPNGDAIGDLPYTSKSLFDNLTGAAARIAPLHLSPASDALDLAAKAFPIFAPQPRMSDPAPLMQPPFADNARPDAAADRPLSLIIAAGHDRACARHPCRWSLGSRKRRRRIASAQSADLAGVV